MRAETQHSWIADLIEILDQAESPEDLLEHTRMAMYQDRIFAFTPAGELIQLPKGATPVDFAYAVHSNIGDQAVGAKVNGRVVPLRTQLDNGDQVQILRSKAQQPQANWLSFAYTGKARAAIRRHLGKRERDETATLGRKLYDQLVARLPAPLSADARAHAIQRLKLPDEATLMTAIARRTLTDAQVMEALMPGATGADSKASIAPAPSIAITGLTPGVAFTLAECCMPIPGDRIVGLRRPDAGIEIHRIDCAKLGVAEYGAEDADWVDVAWGEASDGGAARIQVDVKNEPGALGIVAGNGNMLAFHELQEFPVIMTMGSIDAAWRVP